MVKAFSEQLETWLKSDQPKTIGNLVAAFGEKSFAIVILLLMFVPALPLPTAGITHVFEIIVMLLALEMMLGRRTIWLPKFLLRRRLGKTLETRAAPFIMRKVRWFERHLHPRWRTLINSRPVGIVSGVFFFILALGAFVAPPGSGLDTFPSLGAVALALALILEDALAVGAAIAVSMAGIYIIILTGQATIHFVKHLF